MSPFDIINARQKAGMSLAEYKRIYEPDKKQNGCCIRCKNTFDGCSWSREGEPVQGWIAEKTEIKTIKGGSYKIYFCPEYAKDNRTKSIAIDDDATDLLEAVIEDAERAYRKAYRDVRRTTKKLKDETISDTKRAELYSQRYNALVIIREIEEFLPREKTEKLKREFSEKK